MTSVTGYSKTKVDALVGAVNAQLPVIDTAANLASSNQVLSAGRRGFESDAGRWKTGDGTTPWNMLPYDTPKPRRVNILDRCVGPTTGSVSDGTKQGRAWRYCLDVLGQGGHSLEFTFSNMQNNGGVEADGPNSLTFFAALECPDTIDSPLVRVTPVGGSVLAPGQQIKHSVNTELFAGQVVYLRVQVYVASAGQKWGNGAYTYLNRGGTVRDGVIDTSAAPSTDITMTAAVTDFAYNFEVGWSPIAVTAITETPTPSVLIVGTSIAQGQGNSNSPDQSYITMALKAAGIPYQNISMPSSAGFAFAGSPGGRIRRMNAVAGIQHTDAIWEHITNDTGINLSDIQIRAIIGWRALAAQGMRVWALTGVPKTNSANTVTDANNAKRVGYNNWLRDGAPMNASFVAQAVGSSGAGIMRAGAAGHPLKGYFEAADLVESSRDSGLWASTTLTGDGVHPTLAGHTALEPAIVTSKLIAPRS